ncbi:MAG: hypothetical protein LBV27_09020 [Oscillospiraceae bacterium]|jgi:hypothetical protein|nr:hypothetical protein [Oscillospiraceae bacterium]
MGTEKLAHVIKRIVKEYIQDHGASDVIYATYTGSGLKLDDKPDIIDMDMVDVPQHLSEVRAELSFSVTKDDLNADGDKILEAEPEIESIIINKMPVIIKRELEAGDHLVVIVKSDHQRYAVIDRM